MIIQVDLTKSALDAIPRDLLEEKISHVLRVHRRGQNLVIMSREAGEWTRQNLKLIDRDQATLSKIIGDTTQHGNLARRAPYFIRVAEPGTIFDVMQRTAIQIPMDHNGFEDMTSKPLFVVEDYDDAVSIYSYIFNNMPGESSLFQVNYEIIHGGGQSTLRVAEGKIAEKRIICCVVDSDRKSPLDIDHKSEEIRRIKSKYSWPLFFGVSTPCHELENVLHHRVLSKIPQMGVSETNSLLVSVETAEMRTGCDATDRIRPLF